MGIDVPTVHLSSFHWALGLSFFFLSLFLVAHTLPCLENIEKLWLCMAQNSDWSVLHTSSVEVANGGHVYVILIKKHDKFIYLDQTRLKTKLKTNK